MIDLMREVKADGLTVEEIASRPPEYRQWNEWNFWLLKIILLSALAIGITMFVIRKVPRLRFYAQQLLQNPIVRTILTLIEKKPNIYLSPASDLVGDKCRVVMPTGGFYRIQNY